ncbi:MAG: hypothetical protein GX081_09755 [Firmicutes bacterium]|jgi:hypothetical protein|nr:hypothetical protein [Bacillota bacterium]
MHNKIIRLAMFITIIFLSLSVFANNQWTTSVSKDEMTEAETWYAFSPSVGPVKKMSFPYGDTKAWLGIGCDGEDEWVYVGFTVSPNLTGTTTRDGYDLIYTRIKWDDQIEDITLTQSWGSKFLHFTDDESVISKIAKSKSVLFELNWYGEGKVYFRFPLDGSAAAINKIRNAFTSQK